MPDARLAAIVLDHVEQGLVLRDRRTSKLDFANRHAYEHHLVLPGVEPVLAPELDRALPTTGQPRPAVAHVSCGDRAWQVRAVVIAPDHELLVCTAASVQARERVRYVQAACRLTERQADVLFHMLNGHAAATIARRLGISATTVYRHQADLRDTLGVESNLGVLRRVEELEDDARATRCG